MLAKMSEQNPISIVASDFFWQMKEKKVTEKKPRNKRLGMNS